MTPQQLAVWYLMIADDYLCDAKNCLEIYRELKTKISDIDYNQLIVKEKLEENREKIEKNCEQCLAVLEKAVKLDPNPQFEDQNGAIQDQSSIKSDCYFCLGGLHFNQENYSKAIEYYKNSYEADPNQVSIYNIAMATMNLPVEGGGVFGGKKKQVAQEAKREQEIQWLKKTIKFAPFSELGRKSGRILMENYKKTTR